MTPSFVLDSSVAMSWCFRDEAAVPTRKLLDGMGITLAVVPAWWYVELANVLALAEKNGRIDSARVAEFIALVEGFKVEVDNEAPQRAFSHLLPLCRTHKLTSYDAIYLDLAVRRQLPLATLDEPLRKAAKKLGVKLLGK
jgi:predicted nucleic acid-binding protein